MKKEKKLFIKICKTNQ